VGAKWALFRRRKENNQVVKNKVRLEADEFMEINAID
jgi:hypothetical protein